MLRLIEKLCKLITNYANICIEPLENFSKVKNCLTSTFMGVAKRGGPRFKQTIYGHWAGSATFGGLCLILSQP